MLRMSLFPSTLPFFRSTQHSSNAHSPEGWTDLMSWLASNFVGWVLWAMIRRRSGGSSSIQLHILMSDQDSLGCSDEARESKFYPAFLSVSPCIQRLLFSLTFPLPSFMRPTAEFAGSNTWQLLTNQSVCHSQPFWNPGALWGWRRLKKPDSPR